MNKKELIDQIRIKKSFLSIGLDTDISKIPKFLLEFEDPVFEFNKRIIDSTKDLCVAYKPNIAFYEAMGAKGWESLKKTVDYNHIVGFHKRHMGIPRCKFSYSRCKKVQS